MDLFRDFSKPMKELSRRLIISLLKVKIYHCFLLQIVVSVLLQEHLAELLETWHQSFRKLTKPTQSSSSEICWEKLACQSFGDLFQWYSKFEFQQVSNWIRIFVEFFLDWWIKLLWLPRISTRRKVTWKFLSSPLKPCLSGCLLELFRFFSYFFNKLLT